MSREFLFSKLSPSMEKWFRTCPKTCPTCPRHNPPDAKPKPCCPPSKCEPMRWDKKCIFVKEPCERNHGTDCDCHICKEDKDFHCRQQFPDNCKPSVYYAPHDHGCRCSKCTSSACGQGIYGTLKPKKESKALSAFDNEKDDLHKFVLQIGERCYCLLHHPANCECADCIAGRKEVREDRILAKKMDKRRKQLLAIVERMESKHGKDCDCLKCEATRLRIEMTMCHEHLESCRCSRDRGTACRCPRYAECIRRKRTATLPKAEDYW